VTGNHFVHHVPGAAQPVMMYIALLITLLLVGSVGGVIARLIQLPAISMGGLSASFIRQRALRAANIIAVSIRFSVRFATSRFAQHAVILKVFVEYARR
jgi:hypothetical protein